MPHIAFVIAGAAFFLSILALVANALSSKLSREEERTPEDFVRWANQEDPTSWAPQNGDDLQQYSKCDWQQDHPQQVRPPDDVLRAHGFDVVTDQPPLTQEEKTTLRAIGIEPQGVA